MQSAHFKSNAKSEAINFLNFEENASSTSKLHNLKNCSDLLIGRLWRFFEEIISNL